jgi:molybdopterin-guanine dinucleotide biosynthesis protein A
MMDGVYQAAAEVFEEVLIVANQPERYLEWNATLVTDFFDVRGSLTGIHAGLRYCSHPFAFVLSCDMPFVCPEILHAILERLRPGDDVVVPETDMGLEPLCAVYAKRCLRPIENQLKEKRMRIQGFFDRVKVHRIAEEILRSVDPTLRSLSNINTPGQLAAAEAGREQEFSK